MPFTVTHTIAVVPIARFLPFSGLAIGSLIPDLPLYFNFGVSYDTTHSFVGMFSACLPLGLLACFLWEFFLKRPLLALAPDGLRSRLVTLVREDGLAGGRIIALTVLALLVGTVTHVVWDAFTHEGRWGVLAIASLGRSYEIAGYAVPGYSVFQHGSSVVFLPLLVFLAYRLIARCRPVEVGTGMPVALRVPLLLAIVLLPFVAGFVAIIAQRSHSLELQLFEFVTVAGAFFMLLALSYGVVHTVATRPGEDSGNSRRKR